MVSFCGPRGVRLPAGPSEGVGPPGAGHHRPGLDYQWPGLLGLHQHRPGRLEGERGELSGVVWWIDALFVVIFPLKHIYRAYVNFQKD